MVVVKDPLLARRCPVRRARLVEFGQGVFQCHGCVDYPDIAKGKVVCYKFAVAQCRWSITFLSGYPGGWGL